MNRVVIHIRGGIAEVIDAPDDVDVTIADFGYLDGWYGGYVAFSPTDTFGKVRSRVKHIFEKMGQEDRLHDFDDEELAMNALSLLSVFMDNVVTYCFVGTNDMAFIFFGEDVGLGPALEYLKDQGMRFHDFMSLDDAVLGCIKINSETARNDVLADIAETIAPVATFNEAPIDDPMPAEKFLDNMMAGGYPHMYKVAVPDGVGYVVTRRPVPLPWARVYAQSHGIDRRIVNQK